MDKLMNSICERMNIALQDRFVTEGYKSGGITQTAYVYTRRGAKCSIKLAKVDYFDYVDYGRRAGAKQPPLWAILDWMNRYNIHDAKMKDRSLAYIIARAIGHNGIKPKHLTKEADRIYLAMSKGYSAAYNKDLAIELSKRIKKRGK